MRGQAAQNPNAKYFFWSGESTLKCVTVIWQRALSTLFSKAGVANAYAHRYRDTFAVSLLLAGVPIEDVAVLLGHASTAVTQKHYSPWVHARRERLEALVASTWPEPKRRLQLIRTP